jgi:hypothetical protein
VSETVEQAQAVVARRNRHKRVLTPVFMSFANNEWDEAQTSFLDQVISFLQDDLMLLPYTIGINITEQGLPLAQIKRYMHETNGLIVVAFRRTEITTGTIRRRQADGSKLDEDISGKYFTSPYCQIEAAIAFALGLPIFILREKNVVAEGVLEENALRVRCHAFDSADREQLTDRWKVPARDWARQVEEVRRARSSDRQLYSD